MINYFKCVFFSLLLAFGCGATKYNSIMSPMVSHTMTIEAQIGEWQPIGTAVAVSRGFRKQILSARHVLEAGLYMPLRACSIQLPIECIAIDMSAVQGVMEPKHLDDDWATVSVKHFPRGTWAAQIGGEPQIGDRIWVIGTPLGMIGEITQGIVSNKDDMALTVDARCLPGNSGGPVFNEKGQLVGIVIAMAVASVGVQENVCLAIRVPVQFL